MPSKTSLQKNNLSAPLRPNSQNALSQHTLDFQTPVLWSHYAESKHQKRKPQLQQKKMTDKSKQLEKHLNILFY